MRNIKIKILNPEVISSIHKTMRLAARITQHAPEYTCIEDVINEYKEPSDKFIKAICNMSHTTLQTFGKINVLVYGASRRFLAQITRHQIGVTFMSGSLHYSDYNKKGDYVIPYEILGTNDEKTYSNCMEKCLENYKTLRELKYDTDNCGFVMPQGLRNVLLISADVLEWRHIIQQRGCRRSSAETRYVILKIWEALNKLDPLIFNEKYNSCCNEGHMSCGKNMNGMSIKEILKADFSKLEDKNETE